MQYTVIFPGKICCITFIKGQFLYRKYPVGIDSQVHVRVCRIQIILVVLSLNLQ